MSPSTPLALRIEPCRKRIRAYLGGLPVVDSVNAVMVWEHPAFPAYYFPLADVRMELLTASGRSSHRPRLGDSRLFTVAAGGRIAEDAAWRYENSPAEPLRDLVRFDWKAMDAWFEEDEEVFTHPRDPYTRIDILASSRTVRVELDGTVLAESRAPRLLFETGLPTRYYLPATDLRRDLLGPGTRTTHCPYKGTAEHLSVHIGDTWHPDIAWTYRSPFPESQKIAGLVAFYDEKVDLYVDDVLQERPRTRFS
ncbi:MULTISPECIES: DUF427 domain-containing protein [Kitasatospora]|uniref:Uncharacterized protein (DUF427 family) n=2 Tax=Kitasatospora TaxID=2063 RepID=A0ABT1IYS2_9ACTN|nr:DUF427 domain-containing protein [Kitasatospora paracochleata]MCP2310094.1 uncharacterized protein (DUF427 family) [Kitasatospora paracochleata]